MPSIKQAIATSSDRYKSSARLKPVGIVLHSVGTPQPNAEVFVRMWQSGNSPYFTHYVLDDTDIYQIMPHDRPLWHIGSPGNSKWLGIEMCEPNTIKYTSGASFTMTDPAKAKAFVKACYENAVWLLAKICQEYGWNPHTAILTHNEVSTKKLSNTNHVDPEHLWKGTGMPYTLQTLRSDVAAAMGRPLVEEPVKETVSLNFTRTLHSGISGQDVQRLQKRLIELGYSCGTKGADGHFGAKTKEAVLAFQKDHVDQNGNPLDQDARVGPATTWALEHAESAKPEDKPIDKPVEKPDLEMARKLDSKKSGAYTANSSDGLNVRVGAGIDKQLIGTLDTGARVRCYGYYNVAADGGNWLYIVADGGGLTGYCSEAYLKKE